MQRIVYITVLFLVALPSVMPYVLSLTPTLVPRGSSCRTTQSLAGHSSRPIRTSVMRTRMVSWDGGNKDESKLDPRFNDWVEKSAAKAEMLERAFAMQADMFTTDRAVLKNQAGETVAPSSLRGKCVALLFSADWCPACQEFLPFLKKFYEQLQDKIELVFVSSDRTEAEALASFKQHHGAWLMLEYSNVNREVGFATTKEDKNAIVMLAVLTEKVARQEYKKKYGVWAGAESSIFGTSIAAFKSRKSGVPAILVISLDGEVVQFLNAESTGVESLLEWKPEEYIWPADTVETA